MADGTEAPMREYMDAIAFAQGLPSNPVYALNGVPANTGVSVRTAKRRLQKLEELGLATYRRGTFSIKREVVSQPMGVLNMLYPSLVALGMARRFGRSYRDTDVSFVKRRLPEGSVVTLDYRAFEMTGYQTPRDFCVYVDDVDGFCRFLKGSGFSEGNRGRIVVLPKIGAFDDEKGRVFLDCVAAGGRSFNDAIAISLCDEEIRRMRVRFPMDLMWKVMEDMGAPASWRRRIGDGSLP